MKLKLTRAVYSAESTIGALSIDGKPQCDTLEDVARPPGEAKVFGKTAIPSGVYQVVVTHSPHFGRDLPLLLNVPGFEGVRIHPGNTAADTEGCILLGKAGKTPDFISDSRKAFDAFYPQLEAAVKTGTVLLVIEDNHPGALS